MKETSHLYLLLFSFWPSMSSSPAKNPGKRAKPNVQEKVLGPVWGSPFAWNLVRKAQLILEHQHHSPLNLEDSSGAAGNPCSC